jgi:hypothetical protein
MATLTNRLIDASDFAKPNPSRADVFKAARSKVASSLSGLYETIDEIAGLANPECDAAQCSELFSSKWKLMNAALSVLLPLSISVLSYVVIKPLVDESGDIDNCDAKGDFKRSMRSFNSLCIIASTMSLFITLGMEVVDFYMLRTKDVTRMAKARVRGNQCASVFKICVYIALIVSASVAYGTYLTCRQEAKQKAEQKTK